jgi:beta-glucanase (GH16 family)
MGDGMFDALRRLFQSRHSLGFLLATALLASPLIVASKSAAADGWSVVFEDGFSQSSLDTAQWYTRFIYNNGTMDHFNNELQRYRENGNHVLQDGVLNLIAKGPNSSGLYTSGMIRSRQTFRYGYFEARIKMPPGRGMFPAFWLNSDYDETGYLSWPPEIDIMEFAPNGVTEFPNIVHSNVALSSPNTQGGQWLYRDSNFNSQYKFYRAPGDMTKDWHVYGMLWDTDDTVTVYLDGRKLWQRTYRWLYKDGRRAGPAHILVNLAVGGDWAGAGGIDNTAFPASLQVDYVRVCQRVTNGVGQTTCANSQYAPN